MQNSKEFPYVRAAIVLLCAAVIPYLINLDSYLLDGDIKQIYRGLTSDLWTLLHDPYNHRYRWFRPATLLLCRLDGLIWGANIIGYRITNLLLFALTGFLAWALARKFLSPWAAWIAALIYVIHPIQVGTVTWLSGRVELLPAVLMFACAVLLIDTHETWRRIAGLVVYAVALLSKETAVMFPAALFAGEWLLGATFKRSLRSALPSACMAFIYVVARFAFNYLPGTGEFTFSEVFNSPVFVIRDMMSFDLNILYIVMPLLHPLDIIGKDFPAASNLIGIIFNASTIGPIIYMTIGSAALAAVIIRAVRKADDRKPALFALAWFLIFLIPTAHVFAIMAGFRYFFIPMFGEIIFICWAAENELQRHSRKVGIAVASCFIGLCLIMNVREQLRWKESFDMSERVTIAAISYARSLPNDVSLEVYALPRKTSGGRMVFPEFDTFAVPMAAKVLGNVTIRAELDRGPECDLPTMRCVSGNELLSYTSGNDPTNLHD